MAQTKTDFYELLTERMRRPGAIDHFEEALDGVGKVLGCATSLTDIEGRFEDFVFELDEQGSYTAADLESYIRMLKAQRVTAQRFLAGGPSPFFG